MYKLTQTGSEQLFEVFGQRCERGAAVAISNLPLQEWTAVFANERPTGALPDRLTDHVHILGMNGENYQMQFYRCYPCGG